MRAVSRALCFALFGVLCFAAGADAQRPTSIQCRLDNYHWHGNCTSDSECSRIYCDHLRSECSSGNSDHCALAQQCSGGSAGAVAPTRLSKFGAYIMMPAAGVLVGGTIAGGTDKRTDEQKEADKLEGKPSPAVQGALIGGAVGLGLGFTMDMTAKWRSPLPRIPGIHTARVTHATSRSIRVLFGLRFR